MGERKQYDWDTIGRQYRLGQKSIRIIAGEHGIAHTTILRRAKKEGWVQDMSREVRERTRAALVASEHQISTTPTRDDIQIAVETNLAAVRSHRKFTKKTLDLADVLLNRANAPDTKPRDQAEIFKAVALGLSKVIPLERQALGIDSDAPPEDPAEFNPSERKAIQEAARHLATKLRRGDADE